VGSLLRQGSGVLAQLLLLQAVLVLLLGSLLMMPNCRLALSASRRLLLM
jgi:hypothetical protein